MKLSLITLFPEFFAGPLKTGLLGKSIEAGRVEVQTVDPRSFTEDRHHKVDGPPCGGGGGMVMKPGPILAALRSIPEPGRVLLMSPQGRPLRQADLVRLAEAPALTLISGRYEGYDERVRAFVDEELSLGDFVLTGGEYAALAILDGVVRLLPGTLGNPRSSAEDSFSAGLLEHPQYTRPLDFEGRAVPALLASGHHAEVEAWRHEQALLKTQQRRPDLLKRRGLSVAEAERLYDLPAAPLLLAVHRAAPPAPGELAAWAQLAAAYQLAQLFVFGPEAQAWRQAIEAAPAILYPTRARPPKRKGRRRPPPRSSTVRPSALLSALDSQDGLPERWEERSIACFAAGRLPRDGVDFADPGSILSSAGPVPCVVFSPAPQEGWPLLPPLRAGVAENRLPALAAAAAQLDRVRGEA